MAGSHEACLVCPLTDVEVRNSHESNLSGRGNPGALNRNSEFPRARRLALVPALRWALGQVGGTDGGSTHLEKGVSKASLLRFK